MNKKLLIFKSKKNAFLLAAFASVCTLLVSVTYVMTAPIIAHQSQLQLLSKLKQVASGDKFDNNPLQNCTISTDKNLIGSLGQSTVYRLAKGDAPYAIVFQTATDLGYNGKITLLTAIDNKGVVQGVRTLAHQETPGLGDKIDLAKSDWILSFNGKQITSAKDSTWFVKKDGGHFDQFTGATITPRAVVNQLRVSLNYAKDNFETLYAAPNECQEPASQGVNND